MSNATHTGQLTGNALEVTGDCQVCGTEIRNHVWIEREIGGAEADVACDRA